MQYDRPNELGFCNRIVLSNYKSKWMQENGGRQGAPSKLYKVGRGSSGVVGPANKSSETNSHRDRLDVPKDLKDCL